MDCLTQCINCKNRITWWDRHTPWWLGKRKRYLWGGDIHKAHCVTVRVTDRSTTNFIYLKPGKIKSQVDAPAFSGLCEYRAQK